MTLIFGLERVLRRICLKRVRPRGAVVPKSIDRIHAVHPPCWTITSTYRGAVKR